MTNVHTRRMLCALALAFVAAVATAQVDPWQEKNEAGNVAAQAGRYADAEKLYLAAIKEAEAFGKTDTRLATSWANLATVYHLQNKYPEAKDSYQRSIKILEKAAPPEPLLLASTLDRLALLYRDVSKFDESERCAKRTLELRVSKLGTENLDVADALDSLALVYFLQGTLVLPALGANPSVGTVPPAGAGDISVGSRQQGMTAIEQTGAYQAYSQTHPPSPEEARKSLAGLVAGKSEAGLFPWGPSAFIDKGKLSKAAGHYRQALDIREKLLGPAHPLVAKNLATLADVFMAQRDYATAAPLYLRLLTIEDKLFGPADMRRVPTLRKYSYALRNMKQEEEAGKIDARIYQIFAGNRKP
jgi:tetratricopeptide (TPR) repeat protein